MDIQKSSPGQQSERELMQLTKSLFWGFMCFNLLLCTINLCAEYVIADLFRFSGYIWNLLLGTLFCAAAAYAYPRILERLGRHVRESDRHEHFTNREEPRPAIASHAIVSSVMAFGPSLLLCVMYSQSYGPGAYFLLPLIIFINAKIIYRVLEQPLDHKSAIPPQELYAIELTRVKYFRRQKEFDSALRLINKILEEKPQHPEALLVKAQIMHEGFNRVDLALKYLTQITEQVPTSETIHTWAVNMKEGLLRGDEIIPEETQPE